MRKEKKGYSEKSKTEKLQETITIDQSQLIGLQSEVKRLLGDARDATFRTPTGGYIMIENLPPFPILGILARRIPMLGPTVRLHVVDEIKDPLNPHQEIQKITLLSLEGTPRHTRTHHEEGSLDKNRPRTEPVKETKEARIKLLADYQQLLLSLTNQDLLNTFGRTRKEADEDTEIAKRIRSRIIELFEFARQEKTLEQNPDGSRFAIFKNDLHQYIGIFRRKNRDIIRIPAGRLEKAGNKHIEHMINFEIPDESLTLNPDPYEEDQRILTYDSEDTVLDNDQRTPNRSNFHRATKPEIALLEEKLKELGPYHAWKKHKRSL